MDRSAPVFVAGHRGLVGSAIVRRLQREGFERIVTRSRADLDLTDAAAVERFFASERPSVVVLAAAKVGGILANDTYPGAFIRDNLLIQTHVIDAAHRHGASKLLFLGSSCIYPKLAPQPIREEYLLTGPLEPTNSAYAVAKIAGIEMCRSYARQYGFCAVSAMPTNLYGPNDNFDLENSHVLPALIRKFHEAKLRGDRSVVVWGSGTVRRELLHVDDLADACLFLLDRYSSSDPINVGTGRDVTIAELAELVRKAVGFEGDIEYDRSKPDGTPRKVLDVSKIEALGWRSAIELADGIASVYRWYGEQPLARVEAR
ncbi:MAG: GDP-L-fucose synthase [Polyangiaceae bacterium]|nr:GDP-L-fucose synthase [Polyangiaceae bacterium]